MAHIPESFIERVRDQTNIIDVARQFVTLKRVGRSWKALCPFHNEKTPSFHVNEERQTYHCFGCSAGGNVFSLVMALDNLTFPEAVRFLAERLGWEVPAAAGEAEELGERKRYYAVNDKVAAFYHKALLGTAGTKARAYLETRGLNQEAVETFRIGYADPAWDSTVRQLSAAELADAAKLGLVRSRKDGTGFVDLFRDRIVFPIVDIHNRVVGFGARRWRPGDEEGPKYINSSESPVFSKSQTLYGLVQARKAIQAEATAVLMEGYTDVIMSHLAGVTTAVATLGTALTEGHGKLLKRYAERVVLCYDPDLAGQTASVRGIYILLGMGFEVLVAALPGDDDPADYVKQHGGAGLKKAVGEARDFFAYHLALLKKTHSPATVSGKEKLVKGILPTLAAVSEPVRRDEYLRVLAGEIRVDEQVLRAELARTAPPGAAPAARAAARGAAPAKSELGSALAAGSTSPVERALAKLLVACPELRGKFREDLAVLRFEDPVAAEVIKAAPPVEKALDTLSPAARSLVTAAGAESPPARAGKLAADYLRAVQRRMVQDEIRRAQARLAAAERADDTKAMTALQQELQNWYAVHEELKKPEAQP